MNITTNIKQKKNNLTDNHPLGNDVNLMKNTNNGKDTNMETES